MNRVLQVQNLAYNTPDQRPLIRNLDFDLYLGGLLILVGPNGIGKSSLLRLLLGYQQAAQGSIQWKLPLSQVGFLSQAQNQEFHIGLTLGDILSFSKNFSLDDIERQSHSLLQAKDMTLAWNTASGGERQKTLLSLIFLQDPKVIILDEPMNHLDMKSRTQLRLALQHFTQDGQHAVIMVCHEANVDNSEWNPTSIIDLKGYRAT